MEVVSAVIAVLFSQPWCAGSDTTRAAIDYVKLRSRLHIFTFVVAALYPEIAGELCAFVTSITWPHEIRPFVGPSTVKSFEESPDIASEISLPRKAAGFDQIPRLFYRR
jgi:hypothetical protein